MKECNVLIIGSGLAGSSAAYHLSRCGVRDVTVIERMSGEYYERYHRTCGEAISERMLSMADVPRGCIIRDVDTIRISCGDVDIDVPVEGHIIDRVRLLSDLRGGSDATFIKGIAESIRKDGQTYVVTCGGEEYRCRYLVGADGVFSAVRRDLFGYGPKLRFAAVNNIVEGDADTTVLHFIVSDRYPGAYRWDFPGKDGCRSVGYVNGTDDVTEYLEQGKRFIAVGRDGPAVKDGCCLVGDAAVLTNPVCSGGIGVALISGRKAAECIAKGDLSPYQRWVDRDRSFNPHFMKAQETFREWDADDYVDSVRPFRKGYSLFRGALAIFRRPKWANVYMSVWVAFRRGW